MTPRRVAIVQARMGSSRFPGKVMADLAGKPMLEQQVRRLRASTMIDEIVIATSNSGSDDELVSLAQRIGVRWFRGSEVDVLGRYVGAAHQSRAEVVVRITGDCPLIDSGVVDRVVLALSDGNNPVDYASNVIDRTFPKGLDVEAMYVDVLERASRLATSASAREHVTTFIYAEQPDLWVLRSITDEGDNSDLRWTVDHPSDLEQVRHIYRDLALSSYHASYRQIIAHVRRLNAGS